MNIFVVLILLLLFVACVSNDGTSLEGVDPTTINNFNVVNTFDGPVNPNKPVGTRTITTPEGSYITHWSMYTSNGDLVSFSAPDGWALTPHELTCFAFRFGKNDQSHFVLTATEKGPEPNAINEYVKVLLDEAVRVNAGSLELTNYATYENAYRKSYYISFSDSNKIEATNYYSWITENDKYIMEGLDEIGW